MFNDYLVEATPASYRAGSLQAAYSTPSAERLLFHPFTINSRSGGRKVGSTEMSEAFRSLNGAVDQEDFMYAAQSFSHPGRSGEVANPFKRTNCINCFCMSLRHQDMDVLESTYQYLKKTKGESSAKPKAHGRMCHGGHSLVDGEGAMGELGWDQGCQCPLPSHRS